MVNHEGDEWKKVLRSKIITALSGNLQDRDDINSEIGYYYMCYAPASLYKYYDDKSEKLTSVEKQKMWFSAPCNFNDVFDCDISIDEAGVFNSALQMLPDKRGVRPGSQMWRNLRQTVNKEIRSLKSTFDHMKVSTGISCLSESFDSLLMWAHYANNHSGICLEFELMEINKQLGFTPVPIIYSDQRTCFSSIDLTTIDADSTKIFIESLTSKSPEWSYEKEWRIIQDDTACGTNWDTEKRGALLDMIRPKSVILGCMAKLEFEKSVREYCKEHKINLYKMEKDSALYSLKKCPVLQFNEQDN